jgi:uncharacterized membrane protein YebE (DUF533 family)
MFLNPSYGVVAMVMVGQIVYNNYQQKKVATKGNKEVNK